ncbi:molybdopterin-dependent oxidoreductase [Promicromonospora thailandica]|uniref:DMSO/TMAO reductase YedYZ, molybdopterin-dependent catalytic subunit n=1 Tax=Promicromonospora thailandica TaxID=765201 RepID=A0A9X2JX56_9MICO|nr:molybdopterin-dependent oxidoreductase [Promicromonospora thailandica]MCP2263794.1 DMSO/TMAO reductase YedYZ, molybdopterin-dependent catalytic subunit [Promicromonospora thailandica]BFF17917.1 molybdopterin-dependent oxidoreductase [Promicromonospora thailandica]
MTQAPERSASPRTDRIPHDARWAALAGVVAGAAGLAVAELVAALVAPGSSTLFAGGAAVVDAVPGWLKDFAVQWFGTADKAVLLGTMGVVLAVGAALAGWAELRRPPLGSQLIGAVGVIGAVVAVLRPEATPLWALPSLVGIGGAVIALRAAAARLRPEPDLRRTPDRDAAAGMDRRGFLAATGIAAGVAVLALAGSRLVSAGSAAVNAVRDTLRLPAARRAAAPVPAGADLEIPDLTPYVTPNRDFYRIDTALRVPQLDPADWSLEVRGLVDEPFTITWDELLALPLEEHHATLACVSNTVGGDLIGNALWLGYPIRALLERARPQAGADMVLSRSDDGFTAGTPLEVLLDPDRDSLLAVGMNGEPLPVEHGFPARLVVPGLYGYVSATKWVTSLEVTTFDADQGYWTPRGWSALGPVKVQSRIDVPRGSAQAGAVTVAGVAWAQHTGIGAVEVRADDGDWVPAELAETVGPDTWRQWHVSLDLAAGDHTLTVRATDADGLTQTEAEAPPAPDGATGWHTVQVSVG